jgi:hypothetical protein
MKIFTKTVLVAVVTLMSSTAFAGSTKCYIYVAGGCSAHPEVKTYQWFEDDYNGSGSHGGICVHRASEYRAYCAMPPDKNQYVNAGLVDSNYELIIAQQFRGGADPVSTFTRGTSGNWEPVVTNY